MSTFWQEQPMHPSALSFLSQELGKSVFPLFHMTTPPKKDHSTKEEKLAYLLEAWKCLHDCEACGKYRILKGKDAEILYEDYIEGKRSYMDITFEIRNHSVR